MEVLSEANFAFAKAGCYACTNPGIGVAFDASIEGEGGLYLCRNCLIDAANMLSWAADTGLKHSLDQALERNLELQAQIEAQDDLVKTLNKAYVLYKAREAKRGKRSDGGGYPQRLADVGLGDLVSQPADPDEGQSDRQPDESSPVEVPGAIPGGAIITDYPLVPRA